VNDPADAIPQLVSTAEDTPIAITITAEDIEGDELTFSVTDGPEHGTLSGTAPDLTYTPSADFHGNDFFTFEACDPSGGCDEAVVSINVSEVEKLRTRLVAEPSVVRLDPQNFAVWLNLRATLTRYDNGAPIAGRTIVFAFPGDDPLVCQAVTNADGVASCGGHEAVVNSVLQLGYQAKFAGDADYLATSDNGPLIVAGGLRLLR
jgi:hypothetical protein